jgi:hypothetical protein
VFQPTGLPLGIDAQYIPVLFPLKSPVAHYVVHVGILGCTVLQLVVVSLAIWSNLGKTQRKFRENTEHWEKCASYMYT